MKLEEAYLIVENYDKVKNQDGMSARVIEAEKALDADINKIKEIVENKRREILTWNDLSSEHFKELMQNYYELADGSSKLLNDRKRYELNPTGPIAKLVANKNPKILDVNKIKLAIKNIEIYSEIYQKIKELSNWIREYNKTGYELNIPSVEFKIPLKEINNDCSFNDKNNGTN